MALYQASIRVAAAAAGAIIADLRSPATKAIQLQKIKVFIPVATACQIGLIRPSTVGVASVSVLGQALDPQSVAAVGAIGTTWTTAVAIGAIYLDKFNLPAAVGAGLIQVYQPLEMIIPPASSLVFWNFGAAANPAFDLTLQWNE